MHMRRAVNPSFNLAREQSSSAARGGHVADGK